jgi:hypothetical protein
MMKREGSGSGSISQRHGSAGRDPYPHHIKMSWIRNTGLNDYLGAKTIAASAPNPGMEGIRFVSLRKRKGKYRNTKVKEGESNKCCGSGSGAIGTRNRMFFGPPGSGSRIICTDPDHFIVKQKKPEKPLISTVL